MDEDVGQQLECHGCRKLEKELGQLSEEVLKLHEALEESRRAGKCQAAPFRKPKVAVLKKPGRKSGDDYGTQARRMIPEKIDDTGHRKSADNQHPRLPETDHDLIRPPNS